MSYTGLIVVFISVWFLSVLVLLPFGHQGEEANIEHGTPSGVPKTPRLRLKMLIALGISALISTGVYYAISNQWVTLNELSAFWGLEQPNW